MRARVHACICIYICACVSMIMSVIPWCVCVSACVFLIGGETLSPIHAVLIEKWCLVPGGAASKRAGGRPGSKERGHIHIHRIGHAHVNHF